VKRGLKSWCSWLATLAIAAAVGLELLSAAALFGRSFVNKRRHEHARQPIDRRDGIAYDRLHADMEKLYRTAIRHHPYRWYALPANFHGTYVATDSLGFRNDAESLANSVVVWAFFGGSTMFGTGNDQEHTIVSHFNRMLGDGHATAINMGVGGYSTSAELNLFIEAQRLVPGIQVAVFYDGVNEIARYIESRQNGATLPAYGVLGYPLIDPMIDGFGNSGFARGRLPSRTVEFFTLVRQRFSRSQRSFLTVSDESVITKYADVISEMYVENLRAIRAIGMARGVRTMFFWQPDIFTTRKPLTEREAAIRKPLENLGRLTEAVVQRVQERVSADSELVTEFKPITNALDGLGREDHFYDYCHLSSAGNEAIAHALLLELRPQTTLQSRSDSEHTAD
jgi:hypothetical protein